MSAVGLLERAIGYALGSLNAIAPDAMRRPTPCREWNLHGLLIHVNDSLNVLHEAVDSGRVALDWTDHNANPAADPAADFRQQAGRLLGAWTAAEEHDGVIVIGDCPVMADVVAVTGAVEIAVHGWDIYRARRLRRPMPYPLATELLEISPLLVTDADRPGRFAAPVAVSPWASPGGRLIAFLGRDPG